MPESRSNEEVKCIPSIFFTYQNLDSYIFEFPLNFTEKWGILCPISEKKKSSGRDLKCHKSKLGCHTKFMEIPGSGAKVSPDFECLYGNYFLEFQ